jgi:carboxypeptidase Q
MVKVVLGIIFLLSGPVTFAQQEDSLFIRRIANEILTNGRSYDNLRELTKKIGGRLAGSTQMVMAEKWGAKTLAQAGADKVWLQECMVPHWLRGGKDEVTVKGSPGRSLQVLAIGNSLGTSPAGITADVLLVNSFDDLEARKDSVKGKIVFYNYKFNPQYIDPNDAYEDAYPYREAGASRAAHYGAVAVMIRSLTGSTDNHPHTGLLKYDSINPKIPAVAIGIQDADWLSKQLQQHKRSAYIKTNAHFLPDTIGHNVIGELTGSEFPDQYITVGAHLDSWDPAEGAQDDGAGVVHTIEILQTFKALHYVPRHTIRFVLFANEENGVRGGKKYAEEAMAKKEKHLLALESDGGGFTPRGFGFNMKAEMFAKVVKWAGLLAPYGGGTLIHGGEETDISPLNHLLHIPTAGLNPDLQRYYDYHHSSNDVFEIVNKRELELGSINMAALIYLVDKYEL